MKEKYAFFDVDQTLISFKTMFDFYHFWLFSMSCYGVLTRWLKYRQFVSRMRCMEKNYSREEVNRYYYSHFREINELDLIEVSVAWASAFLKKKNLFHQEMVKRFRELQLSDVKTVLVSGSMSYCLIPIKEYLKADYIISTEVEVVDGMLTGKLVGEPNIGDGKARSIKKFIERNKLDVDYENSYAFGDHQSDIPMLSLVGNAYLVVNGIPCKLDSREYKRIS